MAKLQTSQAWKDAYWAMKKARDAEQANVDAKDAERMAKIYGPGYCAGQRRYEVSAPRKGSGHTGLGHGYHAKMWSKFTKGKTRADRRMYARAAEREAKRQNDDAAMHRQWAKRWRKDDRRRADAEARAVESR